MKSSKALMSGATFAATTVSSRKVKEEFALYGKTVREHFTVSSTAR
ncbi:MAG TPA: hypothetical protein VLD55_00140 [Candidatus Sulfobium mesophilum]|nr:hypothetical protein [Candidatus Sulfobium mesophilum]